MAVSFACEHCGEGIATRFLKPGELALCRSCGHRTAVPGDAAEVGDGEATALRTDGTEHGGDTAQPRPAGVPELKTGSVLGRAFVIWFRNLATFMVVTTILFSPLFLWLASELDAPLTPESLRTAALVVAGGGMLASILTTGVIAYGVYEELGGRRAPLFTCLRVGFSRILPIVGTGLLVYLVCGVTMLIPVTVIRWLAGPSSRESLEMFAIVFWLPAVWLFCMLWLSVPVTVVERLNPIRAMGRSRALTNGVKARIFWILAAFQLLEWVAGQVAEKATSPGLRTTINWRAYLLAVLAISMVVVSIKAVANAIAYHDVVTSKEGTSLEELVAVFE